MSAARPRHTYLVMTQQLPTRTFETIEAESIAEASTHGVVMLLLRADRPHDDQSET